MTRAPVVLAAGINNELGSKDFSAVERLQKAGYPLEFLYYLPKVPAQYSMIPSFNEELRAWRLHGIKMLDELGTKLGIPKNQRHLIDEVLGPDQVFDEATLLNACVILTPNKDQLKQTYLSRLYDRIAKWYKGTDKTNVPIENLMTFVNQQLGPINNVTPFRKSSATNDEALPRRKYGVR